MLENSRSTAVISRTSDVRHYLVVVSLSHFPKISFQLDQIPDKSTFRHFFFFRYNRFSFIYFFFFSFSGLLVADTFDGLFVFSSVTIQTLLFDCVQLKIKRTAVTYCSHTLAILHRVPCSAPFNHIDDISNCRCNVIEYFMPVYNAKPHRPYVQNNYLPNLLYKFTSN